MKVKCNNCNKKFDWEHNTEDFMTDQMGSSIASIGVSMPESSDEGKSIPCPNCGEMILIK